MITETRDADRLAAVFKEYPEHVLGGVRDDHRYFIAEREGRPVGVIFFGVVEDDTWQGHFLMLPEGMGRGVLYARQALKRMFDSGAKRIIGMTPLENRKALRAALAAGFKYVRRTDQYHITECRNGR